VLAPPECAHPLRCPQVYDPRCENVFKYVQVTTASGVAFVHGANDVANAVGPLGGIWWVGQEEWQGQRGGLLGRGHPDLH